MAEQAVHLSGILAAAPNEKVEVSVEDGIVSVVRVLPRNSWRHEIPVADVTSLRLESPAYLGGLVYFLIFAFGWRGRDYRLVIGRRRSGLDVDVVLGGKGQALEQIREAILLGRERLGIG